MSGGAPAVDFHDVGFRYDGPLVVEHVELNVPEGDFLGIIGPNGSGKTTLLRLILGLAEPSVGRVRVFGRPPRQARRMMGYVPQKPVLDPDFPVSVEDVVLMGRLGQSRLMGGYRSADRAAADRAIRAVELHHLRHKRFGRLSGGEQRRALIARALATEPKLLLLDEPTVGVDHRVEHDIYSLLDELNEQVTIVLVSHDVGCVTEHVKHVACVHLHVHVHTPENLTAEVIEDVFRGPSAMARHHSEDEQAGG
jgi:zinc transport system ATP-binding protein